MLESNPPFDLIITDYTMPGMTGVAFTQHLRLIKGYEQTMVVILSASVSKEAIQSARNLGIRAWAPKSANRSDFIEAVRTLFQSSSVA